MTATRRASTNATSTCTRRRSASRSFTTSIRRAAAHLRVHHSRAIRFDGIVANTDSGFTVYDQDWGVSAIIPVLLPIIQDQIIASETAHLAQESNIPVLSIASLRDAESGLRHQVEETPEQIGQSINRGKSNHRMLMIDKGREEFERVYAQFTGIANIATKFEGRVAAAGRYPQTRWMGASPAGMDATGDSDMRNYVMMVEAAKPILLGRALPILDMVLARDAGLAEPPDYTWPSLLDLSDLEQAEVAKARTEAIQMAVDAGLIDEDEGRGILDGDPFFGELPGAAPEPPEPEPIMPIGGMPPGAPMPGEPMAARRRSRPLSRTTATGMTSEPDATPTREAAAFGQRAADTAPAAQGPVLLRGRGRGGRASAHRRDVGGPSPKYTRSRRWRPGSGVTASG